MRRARYQTGSIVFDKRRGVYQFTWYADGGRKTKVLGKFPTKAAARRAAEALKPGLAAAQQSQQATLTVRALAVRFEAERLPVRKDTARVFRCWLKHVLRYWGERPITEVQPREVELWLRNLTLSPKSKGHVRGVLYGLLEYAMWSGELGLSRNPVSLVRIGGVTKRVRRPRSLTVEEFQKLCAHVRDPFRVMAIVCASLGLRISECLALRWSDVDWLGGKIRIERGIVNQNVDDVKTGGSGRPLGVADELLEELRLWRQSCEFSAESDWIFASPVKLGQLPYSYTGFWRELDRAGKEAGVGHLGTHTFRHSYRSWLDAVGTPIAVQQKLMRHADIRTTMNVYGDVVTDEMQRATRKVAEIALRRPS